MIELSCHNGSKLFVAPSEVALVESKQVSSVVGSNVTLKNGREFWCSMKAADLVKEVEKALK